MKNKTKLFIYLAERWLELHYPDRKEPIDIRWSAILNFAKWLDEQWKIDKN